MLIWLLLFQIQLFSITTAQQNCEFCQEVQLRSVKLQLNCCDRVQGGRGLLNEKGENYQRVEVNDKTAYTRSELTQNFDVQNQHASEAQDAWWRGTGESVSQFMVILKKNQNYSSVKKQLLRILDSSGLVLGHIQTDFFIILTTENKKQEIQSKIDAVLAVIEYQPAYKVSPEVAEILSEDGVEVDIYNNYEGMNEGYLILQVYLIEISNITLLNYEKMDEILNNQIEVICGSKCTWNRYGIHHVWINVPLENFGTMVDFLAGLEFVHWVDAEERIRVYNFFANSIVQVGQAGLAEGRRPFWDVGVNGVGQIVGVGDTGLDYDSCFFRDPNGTAPNKDHRKVVDYRVMGDSLDGSGHGTHVCGTILGQVEDGKAKNHNGIAPGSRIAFTDLGQGEDKYLKLPQEGMEQYYSWSYERGARTHSDSWGGGPNGAYKYTSRDADKFMWENMDFIAVLAAGNEGETYSRDTTINSLAACKNAIAVGSTLGPFGSVNPEIQGRAVLFEVSSPEDTDDIIKVVQAEFGPGFDGLLAKEGYAVATTLPEDGCVEDGIILQSDVPGENLQGKIALVRRGGCNYLDKVLGAQYAGAVAIFIYNTIDNEYGYSNMAIPKTMAAEEQKITMPSAHMAYHVAQQVLRIKQRGDLQLKLSGQQIVLENVPRFDNIASFSSFGPTDDNRIKPDIVAPGEAIRSAYGDRNLSSQNCQTAQLTGTSMSTPVIAGAILLIRQYFQDGFYPTGVQNQNNAFIPSSALVKATLLNGAVDLQGVAETGLPLEPAPSVRQGWGRVNLHTTLALPDSKYSLWMEQSNALNTNENHKYCVKIPIDAQQEEYVPLSVTLVWTDYPADLNPPVNQTLVNDLDLKVISPPGLPRSSRGPAPDPDRRNNVEKEVVRMPVAGASYMVLVTGYDVKEIKSEFGGQPYAVVVTAPKGTVVEQCQDCLECPSPRPVSAPTTILDPPVPIQQQSAVAAVDTSTQGTDDPCACSDTGIDIGTGVNSGFQGCHQHSLADGNKMRSCYVMDSVGCGDGAFPSVVIEGVAWRQCGFFEEMVSSITIWKDPKPGTSPQYIQNETTTGLVENAQQRSEEPLLVTLEEDGQNGNTENNETDVINAEVQALQATAADNTVQSASVVDPTQPVQLPQVTFVLPSEAQPTPTTPATTVMSTP